MTKTMGTCQAFLKFNSFTDVGFGRAVKMSCYVMYVQGQQVQALLVTVSSLHLHPSFALCNHLCNEIAAPSGRC